MKPLPLLFAAVMLVASNATARAESGRGLAADVAAAGSGTGTVATMAPLPPVTNSDPRFGVVQAFESPQLAANAGARWERVPFFWNNVQPTGPGDWYPEQFKMSTMQLGVELQNNIQVVGQIGNPPAWATQDGSTPKNLALSWSDPANYWGQFTYKLAQTYAGRVDTWIIWNEPDFPKGHPLSTWAGTPDDYYLLLKDAYQAMKAANPNARIIFAGTTYWEDVNYGRELFFQRVLESGQRIDPANAAANGYYFDAVDLHLYNSPLDLYRVPSVYKQIMSNFGLNKPVWISETNVLPYDDPGNETPPGFFRASMSEQAAFIIRAFAMALAAGVDHIAVYKLVDGDVTQHMPWGMVRDDGSIRPEYVAYQVATSHFANPGTITYTNSNGVDTISFDRGTSRTWLLVNTAPTPTTATVPWLGAHATLTTKMGVTSDLSIPPLTPGQIPQATVALPGATNGYIGGDPMIVDETNISDVLQLTPESVFFPKTGRVTSDAIYDYWQAHGGFGHFGAATSDAAVQADRTIQKFANATLEAFPAFKDTSYYVQEGTGKASPTDPGGPAGPGIQYFKITGHNVAYAFLKAFNALGGVDVLGYPRTDAMIYRGQIVQFFQRAVMEYHPENAGKASEVVLRNIDVDLTAGMVFPPGQPVSADGNHRYFGGTKHTVANAFLRFFTNNGDVTAFGYPISDEMPSVLSDGAIRIVQYFQRARFEYHPEKAGQTGEVTLGLIGDELLKKMGWL